MFFLVLSILVGGLLIGALGRLIAPGRNRIGLLWTVTCGVGGSLIGGIVARALFISPGTHWLITLVLEVLAAALLVSLVSRRRPRRWA
jgi:uncharacterized membrane protein YeaQ/YmgE (transglycosylase-associated protein family)